MDAIQAHESCMHVAARVLHTPVHSFRTCQLCTISAQNLALVKFKCVLGQNRRHTHSHMTSLSQECNIAVASCISYTIGPTNQIQALLNR